MPAPAENHYPEVTTEPQRQALESMSADLTRKLNAMVDEQNRRAHEFAMQEHSLSSQPAAFDLNGSIPSVPSLTHLQQEAAPQTASERTDVPQTEAVPAQQAEADERMTKPLGTPPSLTQPATPAVPGLPPLPTGSLGERDEKVAAQQRARILQQRREEQRKRAREWEEKYEAEKAQTQVPEQNLITLLEFLGLKKQASDASTQPVMPPPSRKKEGPGCITIVIVVIIILILLNQF